MGLRRVRHDWAANTFTLRENFSPPTQAVGLLLEGDWTGGLRKLGLPCLSEGRARPRSWLQLISEGLPTLVPPCSSVYPLPFALSCPASLLGRPEFWLPSPRRAAGRGSARLYLFHSSFQPKKSIEGKMATDTRLTLTVLIKPHSVIFFYCYINFLTSLTTSQQYFLSSSGSFHWEGLVWFQWSWNLPVEQYSHHILERSVSQEFCTQCVRK